MSRFPVKLALIVLVVIGPGTLLLPTRAYAPICHVLNVAYFHPSEVNPSDHFPVSISLTAQCPQTNNFHFSARFDVTDSMNRVLASNFTQDGFVPNSGKPFTFIVTNDLTAPSSPGTWPIQFIVYTFVSVDPANGLDYEVKTPETIQVGQLTSTQESYNSITVSTTASPTLVSTSATSTTQSIAEMAGPSLESEPVYQLLAIVLGVLFVVTLILYVRRKRNK
jgi:hypothetical protein